MSRVTVSPQLKKKLERVIAEKTARFATKVYNEIVTGVDGINYPYYSGAYINSWDVNQTGKGGNVKQGKPDEFAPPGEKIPAPNYSKPYATWFVANDYWEYNNGKRLAPGMAHEIEYVGTPTQPNRGWMTLQHALARSQFGV